MFSSVRNPRWKNQSFIRSFTLESFPDRLATLSKKTQASRPHASEMLKVYENSDPNIPISPPLSSKKSVKSPSIGSAQSNKPTPKTPGRIFALQPLPERARKFIVAKKSSKRAGNGLDFERCRKEAYEALRTSQEEFFRRDRSSEVAEVAESAIGEADGSIDGSEKDGTDVMEEALDSVVEDLQGGSEARNMRSLVMEEAMSGMPEPGSGRVKHLVKAFENFLSISKDDEADKHEDRKPMVLNWTLPGFQPSTKAAAEAGASSTSIFSSVEFFPPRQLQKNSRLYSSVESNGDRFSWGRRTSGGGRNKRNSSESLMRRSWNKMLKVTSQHPFKLRTEQRGRIKEEQFVKKVKEMLMEEEKQRIPIAQGLPWTTDEPEHLVKPPVKEGTEPIGIVLHSDVRATERAEFDQFVAERMNFAEQLKLEREIQKKLEEEEEIRQLRRELVPKAQPMPYFDRPFIPKRSERPQTIPKEPRFHIRPRKSSWYSFYFS
ncbi:Targeting protein for Xklp2 (TPX2) [Musa troglodytarum]|uniref:Targeting protein for Xklp2 (TPX2) n=1 Tax=Musa troglodytarum TaxID=320322 RepID=A0A9E7GKI8_9LILI|nr:Targeting protein for Xklp2 (TPX2) [Musa troglodytarum]